MFEQLNRRTNGVRVAGFDTTGLEFKKLKDYKNRTVKCMGYMFMKSKFDDTDQVVVIVEDGLITMPKRALEQFREIDDNDELRAAVRDGKLSIEVGNEYMTKYNNTTVEYNLVG